MALRLSLSHKTLIIAVATLTAPIALHCSEKNRPLVYIQLENNPFEKIIDLDQTHKTYSDLFRSIADLQERNVSKEIIEKCKKMLEKEYDKQLQKRLFFYSPELHETFPFYATKVLNDYKKIAPSLESFIESKKLNKKPLLQATTLNTLENTLMLLEKDYKKIITQPEDYYKSLLFKTMPLQGQLKKTHDSVLSLYANATQKTKFFVNRFVDVPYTTIKQAVTQTPKFKSELLSAPEKKAIKLLKNNFKELITSTQMIGQLARAALKRSEQLQDDDKENETIYNYVRAYSSYYMADRELLEVFDEEADTEYTKTNLGIINRYALQLDSEYAKIYWNTRIKSMNDVITTLNTLRKKINIE